MSKFSLEARVGAFVFVGILVFIFFSVKSGTIEIPGKKKGITIVAVFDQIAGLDTKSPARVAGVKIGVVDEIKLADGRAEVYVRLNSGVQIRRNATASLGSLGLLGEKYLEIKGGTADAPILEEGDIIPGKTPVDMNEIIEVLNDLGQDFKIITTSFREAISAEDGENQLRDIVSNLNDISTNLNSIVGSNEQNLSVLVDNLTQVSRDLRALFGENRSNVTRTMDNFAELSESLEKDLPKLLESLSRVATNLSDVIDNRKSDLDDSIHNLHLASVDMKDTLSSLSDISNRIQAGEGTIGKLITSDETHENLNSTLQSLETTLDDAQGFLGNFSRYETYLGYSTQYLDYYDKWKSTITFQIQPRQDKYYLLELIDSPVGSTSITDEETTYTDQDGNTRTEIVHKEKTTDSLLFSFQIAKRMKDLVLRGGLIESTGGVGADYMLFRDHIAFTVEAWDFDRNEEDPHMRLRSQFRFADYLHIEAGWDDFLTDRDSFYVGAGLFFNDKDLKFVLGLLPLVSGS